MRVQRLSMTAVKGTRMVTVDELDLELGGAVGDRRFFIIDDRGRMINGKTVGELSRVIASCSGDRLRLEFPDRPAVEDDVHVSGKLGVQFYRHPVETQLVGGPFSEALSAYVGQELRLVSGGAGIDRGRVGGVSLMSRGSLERLAAEAGEPAVDGRRFRMTVEVDGLEAHAEDAWIGRLVRIGAARIHFRGHVGRCLITSRDPESGVIDLPTLDLLRGYRHDVEATEPLPFGIYGEVVEPGRVRVGDPVALDGSR